MSLGIIFPRFILHVHSLTTLTLLDQLKLG